MTNHQLHGIRFIQSKCAGYPRAEQADDRRLHDLHVGADDGRQAVGGRRVVPARGLLHERIEDAVAQALRDSLPNHERQCDLRIMYS